MMSYYGTFPCEELTEAQDRITEMMDEVNREHASRPMAARGAARYSTVGTNKDDDDEETEDDNNTEDNPYIDNGLVQMDPDNGTGLHIDKIISMGTNPAAEPIDTNITGQPQVEPLPEPGPLQPEDPNQSQIEPVPTPHGQKEPTENPVVQPTLPPPPAPCKATGKLKPSKVNLETDDIVEYKGGYGDGFRIEMPTLPPPPKPKTKQTARKSTKQKKTTGKETEDSKSKGPGKGARKGSGNAIASKNKRRDSEEAASESEDTFYDDYDSMKRQDRGETSF